MEPSILEIQIKRKQIHLLELIGGPVRENPIASVDHLEPFYFLATAEIEEKKLVITSLTVF